MRWSLILSAFIAAQSSLSLVCVALPVPSQLDGLERRGLKLSSKKYRENAKLHPDAYHVDGLGPGGKLTAKTTVTKERLYEGKKERSDHAEKLLKSGVPMHADHVFEVQMLKGHLKQHNINFNHMDPKLQKKVKGILNGPNNMAFIPASINISKGQLIKHGMQGNKIKRQPGRDQYALESYRTAHNTAKRLDKVLQKHPGYSAAVGSNTLRKKLHDTFVSAGLPPGSHKSQSKKANTRPSTPVAGPSNQSGPSTPPKTSNKRQVSPGNSPKNQKKKKGRK